MAPAWARRRRASIAEYALDYHRAAGRARDRVGDYARAQHGRRHRAVAHMRFTTPSESAPLILAGTGARLPVNPALIAGIVADPRATISNMARWMWSKEAAEDLKQQSEEIMLATDPLVIEGDFTWPATNSMFRGASRNSTCPTLILAGETDKMTPPALSQELARRHPQLGAGDHPKRRPHAADGAAGTQRRTHRRLAETRAELSNCAYCKGLRKSNTPSRMAQRNPLWLSSAPSLHVSGEPVRGQLSKCPADHPIR